MLYAVVIVLFLFSGLSFWLVLFRPGWFTVVRQTGSRYSGETGRILYIIEALFCLLMGIIILLNLLLR